MPINEAWIALGFDFQNIITKLAQTPLNQRVEAANQELEDARKAARKLLIAHHPDQGGDPEKFKRVNSALQAIEAHTAAFAKKMAERNDKDEEDASKQPFIKFNK